ncbi:hypothetical protein BU15DRAFT_78138 [Melanogaster broomeanus]|nr:hypothetical protein BU15DRAFT_78138 [Melanogaster broomeanus]
MYISMNPTLINETIAACASHIKDALKSLNDSPDVWHDTCEEIYVCVEEVRTLLPISTFIHPEVTVPKVVMAADLHAHSIASINADGRWTDVGAIASMKDDYTQHWWWRTPKKNDAQPASPAMCDEETSIRDKGKGREVVGTEVGAKAERKKRARKERTIWPEGDDENANANDAPTPPTDKPRPQGPTIRLPPLKLTSVTSSSSVASKKEPACASCSCKNVECLPRGNGACQSCWQGKTRCSLLKKDAMGEPGPIDTVSSPNAEASSSRKRWRDSMEDANPPTKSQQRRKKQTKEKKRERETVQPLSKNAFRRQTSPDPLPDAMPLPPALVPAGNAGQTALEARVSALEKTVDSLMRMVEVLQKDRKEDKVAGLERDLSMAQLASTSRDPSIPTSSAAEGGWQDSCGNSPSIPPWNAITEESLESSDEMDVSD